MNLQGERLIAAAPEATWAALNEPETLKACIAGCETLERVADDEFLATMALRIGPVNARFKGRLKLENIVPISSYTIAFDGQGGVAGFGKGSADVRLTPEGAGTRLLFTHRGMPYENSALMLPGWHDYLARLGASLDGRPPPGSMNFRTMQAAYVDRYKLTGVRLDP